MKTLILPLCLLSAGLVQIHASYASIEVLRAWENSSAQVAAPLDLPSTLRTQSRFTAPHFGLEAIDRAVADALGESGQWVAPDAPWPKVEPAPESKDAPRFSGNTASPRPPGAKRWRYNGQDYWIVPIESTGAIAFWNR